MFTAEEDLKTPWNWKKPFFKSGEALPQAVINNAIDGFRSRVRIVIAENGQHIEKYWTNEQSLTICAGLIFMQVQFVILTI